MPNSPFDSAHRNISLLEFRQSFFKWYMRKILPRVSLSTAYRHPQMVYQYQLRVVMTLDQCLWRAAATDGCGNLVSHRTAPFFRILYVWSSMRLCFLLWACIGRDLPPVLHTRLVGSLQHFDPAGALQMAPILSMCQKKLNMSGPRKWRIGLTICSPCVANR